MKIIKRIMILTMIIALCVPLFTAAEAKSNKHTETEDNVSTRLSENMQTLKTLEILVGSGKDGLTLEYTKSKPTRIQGFILYLRLINKEMDCEQFAWRRGGKNFDDHLGNSEYVQKVMAFAKAHPELNWVGSNGKFNPMAHLTAREYAKIMLTALGYQYDTDFYWKNTERFAEELGLNVPEGAFTFEELAGMTVQTLYTAMKGTSQKLIDHLAANNPGFAAKVALLGHDPVADTTKPTVTDIVLSTPYQASPTILNGQVTIYFSEEMNTDMLVNQAHYTVDLDGSGNTYSATSLSLMTGAAAEAAADKKSVILTIPGSALNGGTAAGAGITGITVSGLADLAGNRLDSITSFVRISAALTVQSSAAVDANKLQVIFSNPIRTVDSTEFKLYRSDGITLAAVGTSYVLDSTGKIVTITLGGSLTADAKANTADTTTALLAIGTTVTKDFFGNTVSGAAAVPVVSITTPATVAISDKIVPSILLRETKDLDTDGYLDAVKLTFNESIKDSSVRSGDFNVAGYSKEAFSPNTAGDAANNNIIYIVFSELSLPDTSAVPEVIYTQGTLEDMAGNKLASTGAVAATDKTAPAVMSALPVGTLTAGGTAASTVLLLSEDITPANKLTVTAAVQAHISVSDLGTAGDISWMCVWTTDKSLTVLITANANGGINPDSIALLAAFADLTDAAGNTANAAQIIK